MNLGILLELLEGVAFCLFLGISGVSGDMSRREGGRPRLILCLPTLILCLPELILCLGPYR